VTTNTTPKVDFNFTDARSATANCTLFFGSTPYKTINGVNNDTNTDLVVNTSLSDANYSVYVNCTDVSSNTGQSGTIYITTDTTPPTVINITPLESTEYNISDSVNITANVTDVNGILSVYANITWIGGSAWQQMTDGDGNDIYDTEFLNTHEFGRYNVTIIANDSVDNVNSSETTYFTLVDEVAPVVNINTSQNNSAVNYMPSISFNFTDLTSDTANCTLYFDGSPYNTTNDINNDTQTILTVNTTIADSNYSVHITCIDEYNNTGQSQEIFVLIDTIPPDVLNVSPGFGTEYNLTDSVNITANVTDILTVSSVYANISWIGGSAWQQMLDVDGDDIYETEFLNTNILGRYNVTIIANDTLNNKNNSQATYFNVTDLIDPTVLLNYPPDSHFTTANTLTFQYTPDDNDQIKNCTLLIDGSFQEYNDSIVEGVLNNITTNLVDGIYYWTINCTDESNNSYSAQSRFLKINYDMLNISVFDDLGPADVNLSIYNNLGSLLATSNHTVSTYAPYNAYYDLRLIKDDTDRFQSWIYDVNLTSDLKINMQVITDYSEPLPLGTANISAVFALNDTALDFSYSEIIIPNSGDVNTILHCLNWDYSSSNCLVWEVNDSKDYSMQENSTHIWFNVTSFDAFGGSASSTLPNITNITVYDVTGLSDFHIGGTEIDYGINDTFNLETSRIHRVRFTIKNEGKQWDINAQDIIYHEGLNSTWTVNLGDIWYTTDDGATNYTGGTWNSGRVTWDSSLGGRLKTDETGFFYYVVNITTTIAETYGLYFLVNDTSKNAGSFDYSAYNITIDTTPPTVNINSSLNNTIVATHYPTVDFNFSDTRSSTANCTLFFNDTPYNTTNNILNYTFTNMTVNTSLQNDNYTVYINCTDESGNIGMSKIIHIRIKMQAPGVNNITPLNGSELEVENKINISANVTDLNSVDYVYANISWKSGYQYVELVDPDANDIYNYNFTPFIIGRFNVSFWANDSLGTINDTETTWFNVLK